MEIILNFNSEMELDSFLNKEFVALKDMASDMMIFKVSENDKRAILKETIKDEWFLELTVTKKYKE